MVCEMLCESRRRAGLPGLAVSWGAIAGVGYLEEVLKVQGFCDSALTTAYLMCAVEHMSQRGNLLKTQSVKQCTSFFANSHFLEDILFWTRTCVHAC